MTASPGCAIETAVADGRLSADRVASHQKLERELDHAIRKVDPRARAEHKRKWRIIHKEVDQHMRDKYGGGR